MTMPSGDNKVFLSLQGPHGPFFAALARMLRRSGATVWRVGFNAGDRAFWPHQKSFIPYLDTPEAWPDTFKNILTDKGVTDIALYGDVRTIAAKRRPDCAVCGKSG